MNFKDLLPYLKDPWTISWLVSGLLAIFIPLITWSINKSKYYSTYGYAQEAEDYYEQQQEYYKQQQEYYEQQQNGDDNYYQQVSYYKECSWFNWACRKKQWYYATYDENGGGDEDREQIPAWFYLFGGDSEEMQRWKEENTGVKEDATSSQAGLKFVYFLTLLLAFTLLGYGFFIIGKKHSLTNLIMLLGLTVTIALMNLIMNVEGVISADDKDLEDSYYGWYGQMGVLLLYTNFGMMLFSLVFGATFLTKIFLENKNQNKENGDINDKVVEGNEYHAPTDENQMT